MKNRVAEPAVEEAWARLLAGEPLTAEEVTLLRAALEEREVLANLLGDEGVHRALGKLAGAERTEAAFVGKWRALAAAEASGPAFTGKVVNRLRARRRTRLAIAAAGLVAATAAAALLIRAPRQHAPPVASRPRSSTAPAARLPEARFANPRTASAPAEPTPVVNLHAAMQRLPRGLLERLRGISPDGDGLYLFNRSGWECAGHQRFGLDTLIVGAALGRRDWVDEGWRAVDVTFARQTEAGNFGDPPVCVAIWLAELGQAFEVLRASPFAAADEERIRALLPAIGRAAAWLAAPERLAIVRRRYPHHEDPRFAAAAALAWAAKHANAPALETVAHALAQEVLATLRADGSFEHADGHDVGMQIGLLLQMHWLLPAADGPILEGAQRAAAWLLTRIEDDGTIDFSGSTITPPCRENCPDAPYHEARWVLALHAVRFDDPRAIAAAQQLRRPTRR